MKMKLTKIGHSAFALGKKYAPTVLLMLLVFTARAAGDGADEIASVWKEEIQPIVNLVLGITIVLGTVYFAIMLAMGKKVAMQIGGYILLAAIVLRVLPTIVEKISGLDFGTIIGLK